eukprot:jgi/Botrbrau1/2564/Bobra.0079s0049.2
MLLKRIRLGCRILSAAIALKFLTGTQAADPDASSLLSPPSAFEEEAANTTLTSSTWSPCTETSTGLTLQTMSQLRSAAIGPSASRALEQLSSNVSAMNPDYIRVVTEGVTAGRGSNAAAPKNVSLWPPSGYTGPISLWIQQDDLPTERPVEPWIVKNGYLPLDTAHVQKTSGLGGYKIHIDHAPLTNVTVDQINWFFNNIDGSSELNGKTWTNYLLMHPRDHIQAGYSSLNQDGKPGTGAYVRFSEILMSENPNGYLQSDTAAELILASLTQVPLSVSCGKVPLEWRRRSSLAHVKKERKEGRKK